jgi:hypothetical protein
MEGIDCTNRRYTVQSVIIVTIVEPEHNNLLDVVDDFSDRVCIEGILVLDNHLSQYKTLAFLP